MKSSMRNSMRNSMGNVLRLRVSTCYRSWRWCWPGCRGRTSPSCSWPPSCPARPPASGSGPPAPWPTPWSGARQPGPPHWWDTQIYNQTVSHFPLTCNSGRFLSVSTQLYPFLCIFQNFSGPPSSLVLLCRCIPQPWWHYLHYLLTCDWNVWVGLGGVFYAHDASLPGSALSCTASSQLCQGGRGGHTAAVEAAWLQPENI